MVNTGQAIGHFLLAASSAPQKTRCPHCRSKRQHELATFFFYDSDESWVIPLSSCPKCGAKRAITNVSAA